MSDFGFHSAFNTNMSFGFVNSGVMNNIDPDALIFITNHQIATGQPMGLVQKTAINNRYIRYKGIGTPNGSDLWSIINGTNTRIWIQCPIDDLTANADAYLMEFVTKTQQGNYVGFTAPDFTPTGVVGDVGKYFQGVFAPQNYNQNSHSHFSYVRTVDAVTNASIMGSNMFTTANIRMTWLIQRPSDYFFYSNAGSGGVGAAIISENPPIGLIGFVRKSSLLVHGFANGTIYPDLSKATTSPNGFEFYWWSRNSNGTNVGICTQEICSMYQGLPTLDTAQLEDFNYIEQLYQQEIITGGRNV